MIPQDQKVSYIKLHASIRPGKPEKYRFRVCIGGDKLEYPGPISTKNSSVTNIKSHVNSTIYTPGSPFLGADIYI